MDEDRRTVLVQLGAAAGVALVSGIPTAHAAPTIDVGGRKLELDPIPSLPGKPTPGKPGDFDFLTGEWRIEHFQLTQNGKDWRTVQGEASVFGILNGIGSVEELRIPARDFSGMGLRLLDVKKQQWSDFWVNARSGELTSPGQTGSFENGAGIFASDYDEDGKPMKSVGVWDLITPKSCRWRQATSADGGKTWAQNWIMHWKKVHALPRGK